MAQFSTILRKRAQDVANKNMALTSENNTLTLTKVYTNLALTNEYKTLAMTSAYDSKHNAFFSGLLLKTREYVAVQGVS